MKKIKKCPSCNSYMLTDECERCGEKTFSPKPPRYSPEDRYGEYRRKQKNQEDTDR